MPSTSQAPIRVVGGGASTCWATCNGEMGKMLYGGSGTPHLAMNEVRYDGP